MKYQSIQRCREVYPVQLMCRCLRVSTNGYYAWGNRPPSDRELENRRLVGRIREHHQASDGVISAPRMQEVLEGRGRDGQPQPYRPTHGRGRPERDPQRQWRSKASGERPAYVRNHFEWDFSASESNTKWVTDITSIHTAERWLYLCTVIDLFGSKVVGWATSIR